MRKVLVSGCFDMMHSGHIAFLKTAADFGQVFACIGSDETVFSLKGRYPVINQSERAFCLKELDAVHEARISRGSGHLDFLPELLDIKPDVFVVNADGDSAEKKALMSQHGIEYIVLDRIPAENLPPRSTTALRKVSSNGIAQPKMGSHETDLLAVNQLPTLWLIGVKVCILHFIRYTK